MGALSDRIVDRSVADGIPLSAHVDLTMRCNELCVHCYRVVEERPELTTTEVKALLADLARAGTPAGPGRPARKKSDPDG